MRPLLHVLTDLPSIGDRKLVDVVRAVLAGGADVVQLRDKFTPPEELVPVATELVGIVHAGGCRLVVNDHLELARSTGADGLHVGPRDLPVTEARAAWPRPALLGASARTVEKAVALAAAGADYLGVGPVFGTSSKADAPLAVGVDVIAEIVEAVEIPIIGIGGIVPGNAGRVIRAGASGVAVISSVMSARDPEAATRSLREALDAV